VTLDARNLHLIEVGDGQLLIKRGVTEMLVSGEAVDAVVKPLLLLLDGTRDGPEAIAQLPESHQPVAGRLLDALTSRQLLDSPGDGSEDHRHPDPVQHAFYANLGAAGRAAPAALADASVVLHGEGVLAGHLRTSLGELGIGRVAIAGDGSVSTAADLVLAVSDVGQEETLLDVARQALRAEVPFLPAWMSELVGFVGPLTYPFETACLRCYQLRVDSNHRNPGVKRALRRELSEDPSLAASIGFLPPMAAVVAHITALEAAKALGRFAPATCAGHSIEVNLVSFRSTVRRVLKVPRCPDCGPTSRHAPRVIRTGPQITES
jgi:bacteriocin biosynthesis cyclodehydratase domain-containing protein